MGVITAVSSKWATSKRAVSMGFRRDNSRRDQARDRQAGQGDYLHFTLYKENKDTMDAVNTIARLLKVKASNFGFAGTKDRRAATVQRISVYRQKIKNLIWLNSRVPNVKVGDFEYCKEPLQLGQHGGNEFVIVLKNCHPVAAYGMDFTLIQRMKMIQQAVECGLAYLKRHGYINYYGLQRFGTHTIGTHYLGMKILKGDLEGFIEDILHVDEHLITEVLNSPNTPPPITANKDTREGREAQNNRDELNRARGITTWKLTKNADKALEFLPKRYSSECAIIRHLGKAPKDFNGAVLSITRGLRMMYIHAYQSYVWNHVASYRWSKYGERVIEGDLVIIKDSLPALRQSEDDEDYNPYEDQEANGPYTQARALTLTDIASGKYTIFDIVLPTPGYDVLYPRNDIGEYYVEFMGRPENGGLNPYEMRRRQREFSLSGNYRHLIGRFIKDPQYAVKAYNEDTEQLYPTDLDFAIHKKTLMAQKKKKAQASGNLSAADKTAISRRRDFSQNPSAYDETVAAAARRRKADEDPDSSGNEKTLTINETYVQTSVDGSAKRIKLSRHESIKHEVSNGAEASTEGPSIPRPATPPKPSILATNLATPTKSSKSSSEDILSPELENDPRYLKIPGAGGAPLWTPEQDKGKEKEIIPEAEKQPSPPEIKETEPTPPRIIADGPIPMVTLPKDAVPSSGLRGVSDSYYASTGKVPFYGIVPASDNANEPNAPAKLLGNPYIETTKPVMSDVMNWYGGKLPSVLTPTTDGSKTDDAKGKEPAAHENNDEIDLTKEKVINGIPMPEFVTVTDDNPIGMALHDIDEASVDPNARKIAVILKFQLRQSNYATVVLRELMGTGVDGADERPNL
mgnify:CR=1 FL=1